MIIHGICIERVVIMLKQLSPWLPIRKMADFFVSLVLSIFCFLEGSSGIDRLSYATPSTCLSQNKLFLSSNFSCVACNPSQTPARDGEYA